ncbi:hypothetical protein KRR39_09365 [Nocardioides panacis]|uniref:6-phosphogluconate dehydrogenase NADP-binding domain-containing protein n=1 Tax=Nocardioides panacis TaxID=2849501 RepID=A0A975T1I8_9ACTN|nr:hypothetical protein KRR39_09365 [Nocardioides panacis]
MVAAVIVAVVGTGRMGAAMVGRIRGAGFPVVVHNRTRSKAEQVADTHDCSARAARGSRRTTVRTGSWPDCGPAQWSATPAPSPRPRCAGSLGRLTTPAPRRSTPRSAAASRPSSPAAWS